MAKKWTMQCMGCKATVDLDSEREALSWADYHREHLGCREVSVTKQEVLGPSVPFSLARPAALLSDAPLSPSVAPEYTIGPAWHVVVWIGIAYTGFLALASLTMQTGLFAILVFTIAAWGLAAFIGLAMQRKTALFGFYAWAVAFWVVSAIVLASDVTTSTTKSSVELFAELVVAGTI